MSIPLLSNALPASNNISVRFLARDPFEDDARHATVLFEEFIDEQSERTLDDADSVSKREQRVRGGSRTHSTPHAPGGEAWTRVEKTPEELAILEEAASSKWLDEFLSGCPPELEIPGFLKHMHMIQDDARVDDPGIPDE